MILAADVGGTNSRLACFPLPRIGRTPLVETTLRTRAYPSLEAMLEEFLGRHALQITAACFGVAAPVINGRTEPVNLPWPVNTGALQRLLGIESVWLINDMEAMAYGIPLLPKGSWEALQDGRPDPEGIIGVVAAGTSLGEVMLLREGQRWRAIASEAGHADYAPRSALEWELFAYLRKRFDHVSYARVLSGPGLRHLYEFLKRRKSRREPRWLTHALARGEASRVISTCALEGRSSLCAHALELFVGALGAESGNLALRLLARGGIYLGGGIAPQILGKLRDGTFARAFTSKGRMAPLLATIPVRVILDERTALYGAAHYGKTLLGRRGRLTAMTSR